MHLVSTNQVEQSLNMFHSTLESKLKESLIKRMSKGFIYIQGYKIINGVFF
jgi:hypothetical protein